MDYLLYWMQAAPRCRENPALDRALRESSDRGRPLLCVFCLDAGYPGPAGPAPERAFAFLAEGLEETAQALQDLGTELRILPGRPQEMIPPLARRAAAVFTDRSPLPRPRRWRREVAAILTADGSPPLQEIETSLVIPPETASPKEEYSAATLRRKIAPRIPDHLPAPSPPPRLPPAPAPALPSGLPEPLPPRASEILGHLRRSPGGLGGPAPSAAFRGGAAAGEERLARFLETGLPRYAGEARDPVEDITSCLSPYLHFGMISPVRIAREVYGLGDPPDQNAQSFLEQLIVRRELAANFVFYNPNPWDFQSAVPRWARESLEAHTADPRPALYPLEQLEEGRTEDPAWNAAQHQMVQTGWMHNYMRMYWGKKVMEWTANPAEAFERLHYLNDTYQLDGRDFNGWTGIAWCFGRHDRPWQEREVFGKVRYMNFNGLRRKFRISEYIRRWA